MVPEISRLLPFVNIILVAEQSVPLQVEGEHHAFPMHSFRHLREEETRDGFPTSNPNYELVQLVLCPAVAGEIGK